MPEPFDTIASLVREVSRSSGPLDVDPRASLFDAGILDSFALPEFVTALEQRFGISIPDSDLSAQTFETLEKITAYVQSHR